MEELINEEEDMIFETKFKLFSIGTITFSKETVSLLSVRVLEIKNNEESDPEQWTSNQTAIKVVPFNCEIKRLFC
jgi:hypothetical protein